MNKPVVLDIETKYSFREVGNDLSKLGVSCVGIYDYSTGKYSTFMEEEIDKLFPILECAPLIIGFNINRFDFPVLDTVYVGNLSNLPTLDLLEDIKENFGRRLPLDELAYETLGITKSGHGLLAIEYYRDGKFGKLKKYCLDDVRITKDLYEYGKKHGRVFFRGVKQRESVSVNWNSMKRKSQVNLTLGI